jgi:hypothetical protein
MLGKVEVLLSHEYTFAEEVLVDLLAVSLGDKPGREVLVEHLEGESVILHCCEFQALFGESHTMLKFLGWWSDVVMSSTADKVSVPENVRLKSWQNLNSAKPTNSQA